MKSISINLESLNKETLKEAVKVLKNGGIIIHPTETVYGIAAVWNNENAIKKVAQIKRRNLEKPFSILVNKVEQIFNIIGWKSDKLQNLLNNIFPAPITVLLPRKFDLPISFWNQFVAIGFRLPDFQLCEKLVEMVGEPVITTSANIENQPPPKTPFEISKSLLNEVDLFLDGGDSPIQIPSTVLRFDPDTLATDCIREGSFPVLKFKQAVQRIYGR